MTWRGTLTATVAAIVLTSFAAQAQQGGELLSGSSVRPFLPVYAGYAFALQKHGVAGFQSETSPGFTLHHDRVHPGFPNDPPRWVGKAAIAQAAQWLDGAEGGRVAVTIRHLTITGKTAVALTQESITYRPDYPDIGNATASWYWKQTWRQTGQRWRLTDMEPISEKALGPPQGATFTVTGDDGPSR